MSNLLLKEQTCPDQHVTVIVWATRDCKGHSVGYTNMDQSLHFICTKFDTYYMYKMFNIIFL